MAETIANKNLVPLPENPKILDVGAGTGAVGNLLKSKGFTDILGIDASAEFIKVAQAQGAY